MFCLVLAAPTIWNLSSIYLFTSFLLGKLHVHVGLGGGEGDGGGIHLVVGGKGGGGDKLLVVDDKGDGDGELLVIGGEGVGSKLLVNLVLDPSFTSFA
jgi:hypothetical protein